MKKPTAIVGICDGLGYLWCVACWTAKGYDMPNDSPGTGYPCPVFRCDDTCEGCGKRMKG